MSTKFTKIILAMIIIISSISFTSCKEGSDTATVAKKENDRVLATYSNGKIYLSAFEAKMLKDKFKDNLSVASKSGIKEREAFLISMLEDKFTENMISSLKLDTMKNIRVASKRHMDKLAKSKLYQEMIVDKVVTEADIVDEYKNGSTELRASHILLKTTPETQDAVKVKIDELYKKLTEEKVDFAALAIENSEDIGSGKKGGDLGWFGKNKMVKPFEFAAFRLKKDEISKPVKTKFGYHIIKLTGKRNNKMSKTFEESKEEIKQNLFRARRAEATTAVDNYLSGISQKYGVKIDTANVALFIEKHKIIAKDPKVDKFKIFTEEESKKALATYKKKKITIGETLKKILMAPPGREPKISKMNDLVKIFQGDYIQDLLAEDIAALGYANDVKLKKEVAELLKPDYKKQLEEVLVTSKLQDPTQLEIQKYYEGNKDKKLKGKAEETPTLEKVEKRIIRILKRKKKETALKSWKEKLMKENKLEIDKLVLEDAFYFVEDDKK